MSSVVILLSAFDPGTYHLEDDGIPNNGIAQLRSPDGSVIPFSIPTEFLTVTASAGRDLVINLTESFGSADITVGSLTNAADNPDSITVANIRGAGDVVLASNGAITEFGSDAAADVVANTLVLSAGTGVGVGGNALETQVATLEAETGTGGINLGNTGTLTIGGLSADVAGLDVATSGNLRLSNLGSIVLADETALQSIHGAGTSGNVTLIARGASSDITSAVDQDAITAAGGSVTLTAGRDVSFGTGGISFDNDVRARDDLTISAGRDVNVDGFADLASDGFGAGSGGDVVIDAGRDINVLNVTGTDGSIGAEGAAGGNIILTAGADGFVKLLASGTATLFSSSGNVTVNADHIVLAGTAGITASGGVVTLRPFTEGWSVDLGSAGDSAFALELSDAELDRIFTPSLTIGSQAGGPLSVVSALTPASIQDLTLLSGTDILVGASLTVTQVLSLIAGDNLLHTGGTISATSLSGQVDNAGDDLGTGGFGAFGSVGPGTAITLSGKGEADTLRGVNDMAQTVQGKGGNDTLFSSGEGSYFGDGGDDTIFAGLSSGLVPELLDGGAGIDTLDTTSYIGAYVIDMATGVTNFGIESFVNFENIRTGDGSDDITGTGDANTIQTGSGNDTIDGGAGDDSLSGGEHEDLITGGAGKDTLTGGGDRDVFRFNDGDLGALRPLSDVVTDFSQAAGERIHLAAVDANTNVAGNQAFNWIGNGAFTGVARQLHFVQQGGKTFIEGDTNGDGAADFVITLTGTINLLAADIAL